MEPSLGIGGMESSGAGAAMVISSIPEPSVTPGY